jgi:hypothetical protein
MRCYYMCRNTLYFTLYEYADRRFGLLRPALWRVRPAPGRPGLMRGVVWQMLFFTMNFLLRPRTHEAQIRACFRGIWHGVTRACLQLRRMAAQASWTPARKILASLS